MILNKQNWFVLLVIMILLSGFFAPTHAAQIMPSWGSVPRGMGEAYVAGRGTLSGVSYNPAISSTIRGNQFISGLASRNFTKELSIRTGSLGLLHRSGSTTHSFLISRDQLNFDFGNFSHTAPSLNLDLSHTLGGYNLAFQPVENLHLGSTINYLQIHSSVEDGEATGWGTDLGVLYSPTKGIALGISARNLLGRVSWSTGTDQELTTQTRGGVRIALPAKLELESGAVYNKDQKLTSLNAGLEWWIYSGSSRTNQTGEARSLTRFNHHNSEQAIALRAGVQRNETTSDGTLNPAFGLTTIFGGKSIHYSFHRQKQGDYSHSYEFSMNF